MNNNITIYIYKLRHMEREREKERERERESGFCERDILEGLKGNQRDIVEVGKIIVYNSNHGTTHR